MATNTIDTKLKLSATDRASATFKRVAKNLSGLNSKIKKVSNSFATARLKSEKFRKNVDRIGKSSTALGRKMAVGVSAPILAVGAATLKTAATFQKSMNLVEAKTGASEEAMKKLTFQARELGKGTVFSASQAAEGMAFLGKAGFKTNEILEATPALLNLAASSQIELGEAANIASNIMGAFNIKANETGRVADVLATITSKTNVDMTQLSESMKFAGPVAKEFGLSLEETASAVGLLGNVGIQGTSAGTALKRALLGLAAPTSNANKLLKAIGVPVADSGGKMLKFSEIMTNLSGQLENMPQKARLQVLNELFGKIGIAGAASLSRAAKQGKLKELQEAMLDVKGNAEEMAKIMNKGAVGSVKKLQSAIEELQIQIGESGLLKDFENIVTSITKFVSNMSDADKETFNLGVKIALIAAAAAPLLIVIGLLAPVVAGLGTAFAFIGAPVLAAIGIGLGTFWALFTLGSDIITAFSEDSEMALESLIKTIVSFIPFGDALIDFYDKKGSIGGAVKAFFGITDSKPESSNFVKPDKEDAKSLIFGGQLLGNKKPIKGFNKKDETKVTVDFKNMPKGVVVKETKVANSNFTLNRGAM